MNGKPELWGTLKFTPKDIEKSEKFIEVMERQMKRARTFGEVLCIALSPLHYTWKQRNRIFRRRPKWWREKWKRVYLKKQKHEFNKMLKANLREDSFISKVIRDTKKDSAWRGGTVVFPVNKIDKL